MRCSVRRGGATPAAEPERIVAVQHQAMRWTYLGSGISHPNFLRSVRRCRRPKPCGLAEAAKVFN